LVHSLGVDLMTLNGGKIYGPKQSGVLYLKTGVMIEPQIRGGGQERGLRSGTENVAASVGFAMALREAATMREAEVARLTALRDACIKTVQETIPAAQLHGPVQLRLANNVHFTFSG